MRTPRRFSDPLRQFRATVDALFNQHGIPDNSVIRDELDWLGQQLADYQAELITQNEELLQARHEAERERDNYFWLFDHSPSGYLLLDASGIIQTTNRTFRKMVRRTEKELAGKPLNRFLGEADAKRFLSQFKPFFKEPVGKTLTLRLRTGRSTPMFIQLNGYKNFPCPGSNLDATVEVLFVSVTDITDRVRVEQQVQASNDRLQYLLERIPVGMVIIDYHSLAIVDANPQAMHILGQTKQDLVGRPCHDHFCTADAGKCPIKDKGQRIDRSEKEAVTKAGNRIPILKTVLPIEMNQRRMLLECFLDITEQKQAESDRLGYEKLQGSMEMAKAVCHELNQPLQALYGYCQLLMAEPDLQRVTRWSGKIHAQAHRLSVITDRLMTITRYETKPYVKGERIVDIDRSSFS